METGDRKVFIVKTDSRVRRKEPTYPEVVV